MVPFNVHPEKDNDVLEGIKGDPTPCECDVSGNEATLTTPETKNENDEIVIKYKNEDPPKKSDYDCC